MGQLSANGGVNQVDVRFSQRFSDPPVVSVACGQSRASIHVDQVTSSGFSVQGNNYGPNNIGSMPIKWYAVGI